MREKTRYLLKNMLYFGFGSVVPKLLSMLIVPLYTACLSTAEYGIAELILNTASLFLALFTLNISESVLRCTLDRSLPHKQVLSAAIHIFLISSLLLGLGLIVFSFVVPGMEKRWLILFYLTYLPLALNSILSAFCRGTDRVAVLTQSQMIHSMVTLSTTVLFLLHFHWGVGAYLMAAALGSLSASLYCVFRCRLYRDLELRCSRAALSDMLSYSAPLVFSTVAWWLGSVLDRWLLGWYHGTSAVGLYAIAFKIPAIFTAVQSIFSQAWRLSAIKDFDPLDRDGFISTAYETMLLCLNLFCSLLLLIHLPLAKLLYSKEFFAAWKYTPILLLALLFSACSLFLEDLFRGLKNSRVISLTLCFGTSVNLLLNILFIPRFGIYAAAVSSLLSAAATWALRRFLLRKELRLRLCRKSVCACLLLILQMILACCGEVTIGLQLLLFGSLLLLYRRDLIKTFQTIKTH